ncbi:kelch-like protein 10 [Gadus chalcogrammus]|uniref:kelch-like protein 10 n=1 Tax=Gadus chalcogrammus TaxID=1042646 RepID=UPI0024C4C268|nr:kelch-like protein 10 [Gadus chalcogrammus]
MDEGQEVDCAGQEVGLERTMSSMSCNIFNELRLEGKLCDVVLEVEGLQFKAHKNILCGCSPYFRVLFTHNMSPVTGVYPIPGVSADTMQLLIEYAYTRHVEVTWDNVEALLVAADYLSVMGAVRACCGFLGGQLSVENAVGIWRLTNHYPLPRLRRRAYLYILRCFEEVARVSEEFPELSLEQLGDLLGEDTLNAAQEEVVFEALLRWISHAHEERRGHISQLLLKVRMGLMDTEYFRGRVKNHSLVRSDERCRPVILEVLRVMYDRDMNTRLDFSNPLTRPRLPHAVLLAVGGWSGGAPTNSMESYDARSDRWVSVTDADEAPRAYHGVVSLGGALYCVGGFDGVQYFNSVRRFDLAARRWHQAAPMHAQRCYVSVAALDGCVYAMGGYDGHTRLSSLERYQPEENQWTPLASMHEQRSDASATSLHDKVYICGGYNGSMCLQSSECYDPRTDQWTLITPMGVQRSGVGVVAYKDHVYALGGFDGVDRLRTVEAYSPATTAWRSVPSMFIPRSNFGVEVLEGLLYVAGGFNGHSTTFNAECYDDTTQEWSDVRDMAVHRSALSCCVVTGLSNVTEYAFPRPSPAPPGHPDTPLTL